MINYVLDDFIDLMIEKSRSAFSPERIIGTIKIYDAYSWSYIYLLYFDYSYDHDTSYFPWDDKMYALVYDSWEESCELCCFSLRDFYERYDNSAQIMEWDISFDNSSWWLLAYRHFDELKMEKMIADFYWNLELSYHSTFDSMFLAFCLDSGYDSLERHFCCDCNKDCLPISSDSTDEITDCDCDFTPLLF